MTAQLLKQLFHQFSGTGKRQVDIDTSVADADIDKRRKVTVSIEDVITGETIYDCSEQDIFDETVDGRLKRFTFAYSVCTAQEIAFWLAFQLGAAAAPVLAGAKQKHSLSRSTGDDLPHFSYVRGYEDSNEVASKFSGLTSESLKIDLNRRKRVTMNATALGRFLPEAVSGAFEIAECENPPSLHGRDCRLVIDGVNNTPDLYVASLSLNNNIPTGDDAFAYDGIDVQTLQRGDKPTYSLSAQILGSRTDALYTKAQSRLKKPVILQLGADADDHVIVSAPTTMLKLASAYLPFIGELNRSAISLDLSPHRDSVLGAPLKADAYLAQTEAFLTV